MRSRVITLNPDTSSQNLERYINEVLENFAVVEPEWETFDFQVITPHNQHFQPGTIRHHPAYHLVLKQRKKEPSCSV